MNKYPLPVSVQCSICKKEMFTATMNEHQKLKAKKGLNVVCSNKCHRILSSQTMSRTNKIYASARMKTSNPMSNPETRLKVSQTLKELGHKPLIQGGNGRGPTVHEKLISDALHWPTNVIVSTKMSKYSGYPNHYKLDIGDIDKKIGVEIDGQSHNTLARQNQDVKKENFLASLGWTIIRFTNKEVETSLQQCVEKVLGLNSCET
jgi:hypothetical protein